MSNPHRWTIGALVLALLGAGCTDPLATPSVAGPQLSVNGAGRLNVYNGGIDQAVPQTPCLDDARHLEFDFWVGSWQMGVQRSVVRKLLDGCIVEENYMPPAPPTSPGGPPGPVGVTGRSINAYDRDTGKWHQTWVSVFPNGHLRMAGGLEAGIMKLGMQAGTFIVLFNWERVSATDVVQSWSYFGNPFRSLQYSPLAGVTIAAPTVFPFCQPGSPIPSGVRNRELDFLLGDWEVRAENGPTLGTSHIASDLNGCSAREDYATDKGYGAHSYIYYDVNFQKFYRTYIDSEAERVELSGDVVNGELVLQGAEPGPGGKVFLVRNRIKAVAANTLLQTWEVSDDGQTWTTDLSLSFTRR